MKVNVQNSRGPGSLRERSYHTVRVTELGYFILLRLYLYKKILTAHYVFTRCKKYNWCKVGHLLDSAYIISIIIHSKYFPVSDWLKPHA